MIGAERLEYSSLPALNFSCRCKTGTRCVAVTRIAELRQNKCMWFRGFFLPQLAAIVFCALICTPGFGQNSPNSQADGPQKPAAQGSSAQQNPFPEAQSEAAAKSKAKQNDAQQNAASQQNSAPAGYSSSNADLPLGDLGQGALGVHEKMDTYTRDHTMDGRIADDLNVADLYMKNGNYRGALWRYQDVIQYDPENDAALFGVADANCKLNNTVEAMTQLKSYAKSHPQGKHAVEAEKLIAHPNKCMHNW